MHVHAVCVCLHVCTCVYGGLRLTSVVFNHFPLCTLISIFSCLASQFAPGFPFSSSQIWVLVGQTPDLTLCGHIPSPCSWFWPKAKCYAYPSMTLHVSAYHLNVGGSFQSCLSCQMLNLPISSWSLPLDNTSTGIIILMIKTNAECVSKHRSIWSFSRKIHLCCSICQLTSILIYGLWINSFI